ncbi:MAG: hypothetical protein ACTSPQ_06330 [Candidatus Helarchaeota archaeon]
MSSRIPVNNDKIDLLRKIGLSSKEIDIVMKNIDDLLNTKQIDDKTVEIVINNLIKDSDYRKQFFTDPRKFIMEANPQPSP